MASQPITAELRRWILAQAAAGHPRDVVLDAMKVSGWAEAVAIAALDATLANPDATTDATAPPRPLPGARLAAGMPTVRAAGQSVHVVMALGLPRVVVLADLITADECEELIALARSRLARSETVETSTGASAVNPARTSEGMFFEPGEFPVCARVEERIAALLDWPLENGEGLQILRYGPGAEYKPHYDYFDPAEAGTPSILERGGQRVGSLVCLPQHARGGRRHRLSGSRAGGRAGARQRGLLRLRPRPSVDPDPARRRSGRRGREVGRDQVAARGPLPVVAR